MRAKEFITESGQGSIQDTVADALPATFAISKLQNQDPYLQYRFGVALAKSSGSSKQKDVPPFEPRSTWGENAIVVAYDNESEHMISQALADMGLGSGSKKMISTPTSKESSSANVISPVAKPKRNKYGV